MTEDVDPQLTAEDVERQLTAAAQALREHDLAGQRCAELRRRVDDLERELSALRKRHAAEEADVQRLEGLSLTRILATLRGERDATLARERAEAETAGYRLADARARLAALRQELSAAQVRQRQLADAPAGYAAALAAKEGRLAAAGDPRHARLLELAEQRGRLTGELREITEAQQAAAVATDALSRVRQQLARASSWSMYDTFLGGGTVSSLVKHSRLDEAEGSAAYADRCLAVLRTELADVPGMPPTAPQLNITGLTRFIDVWFDNIFTDLAVRDRIKQAQANVDGSLHLVGTVQQRLRQRAAETGGQLAALDAQRRSLLTGMTSA